MSLTVTLHSNKETRSFKMSPESTVANLKRLIKQKYPKKRLRVELDPNTPLSSLESLTFQVGLYRLSGIETEFNERSKGQTRRYELAPIGQYQKKPQIRYSVRRFRATSLITNGRVDFHVDGSLMKKLKATPHRNFIAIVSRNRSKQGNFLQELTIDCAFIFVFVEQQQYKEYVEALSECSSNHIVVALPKGYEGRGAPTARQFAKLFIEALNARLEIKATHFIMADDDLLHCNRRFKGKKTVREVSLEDFVSDLFIFGRENPHLALVSPRPKQDQTRPSAPKSSGMTSRNQKLVLINTDFIRDVQYLPEPLLLLSSTEWNELVEQEANHLATQIYKWKHQLRHQLRLKIAKKGRALYEWKRILEVTAKELGLNSKACEEIKAELMRPAPKRDKKAELEALATKFMLSKKTFLTTGEDFRFSGQLLGKDLCCAMLNWFFLVEPSLTSVNQTGSFLPTPKRQHQRMARVVNNLR